MKIEILISDETVRRANTLLKQPLPASIRELWQYFQELSNCLWKIRDEINDYIDSFSTKNNLPGNYRYDPRFDDSRIKLIEDNIQNRMDKCSEEAKRIEKEKETFVLNILRNK